MRAGESTEAGARKNTEAEGDAFRVIEKPLFRHKGRSVTLAETPPPAKPEPVRRPARVAQQLALAHHLQAAIDRGAIADRADVARKLGLTRARVTQLLDLLLLAPDLQDLVLALEAVDAAEPMAERTLRSVAHAGTWVEQRAAWEAVNHLKPLDNRRGGSVCSERPKEAALTMKPPNPTPEEARTAFAAVADQIGALRSLSLSELERKHLELLGVPSAIRSRDALIKKISLALQRRACAPLSGRAGSP
jgi:hypothetical protein